jgi:hypothetical protein
MLDKLHGASIPAIARSAALLAEDADLLEHYTMDAWNRTKSQTGLNKKKWEQEPTTMQRRLLKMLCIQHNVPIRSRILAQFQQRPTRGQLPGGGWLMTVGEEVVVCPARPSIHRE